MNQSVVPNRSVIGVFYSNLLKLDTPALKTIHIKVYAKWERRLIDAERNRRKINGDAAPSKAERTRIISFGEGKKTDTVAMSTAEGEPPTETTSTKKKSNKKKTTPASTEVDGEALHEHVANSLDYHVSYDKALCCHPHHERSLAVYGTLQCLRPTCRNTWTSGICATVLEFSRSSMTYRTTIHSQGCRDCGDFAEPKLDLESYASKVKWVLDLWTGNRDAVEPVNRGRPSGPHEESLCHACGKGKCPWQKRERH